MKAHITSNGEHQLTPEGYTLESFTTVHVPADIGTATVAVGWKDSAGTVNDYADGALTAGSSAVFNTGAGIDLQVTIASYSTAFTLHTANSRSR